MVFAFISSLPVKPSAQFLQSSCKTNRNYQISPSTTSSRRPPISIIQCSIQFPKPRPSNIIPLVTYIAYMSHLFIQSPTGPPTPVTSLTEALQLSLNFAYLTPIAFPNLAPVLHPFLEAIFHLVVSWAILLIGFSSEDVKHPSGPRAAPFFIGAAFLTNILYLPYLILRDIPTTSLTEVFPEERSSLVQFGESRALPIISVSLVLVSFLWALLARPEFGDSSAKFNSFLSILNSDILAYSFAIDTGIFSVFQAWLVRTDASRRVWKDQSVKDRSVSIATFVPFFGLAYYLWERATNAPIRWKTPNTK